jgi:paraquat-inducible protein A
MPASSLTHCPECDLAQRTPPREARGPVLCARCGALLYRQHPAGEERALIYALTAAIVFIIANISSIATVETPSGRTSTTLVGAAAFLRAQNSTALAGLVLTTGFLLPALEIVLTFCLLITTRRPVRPNWFPRALQVLRLVRPWAMIEVLVLAALAALARLGRLADVEIGWGLWAFGALMILMVAVRIGSELPGEPRERRPRSLSRTSALLIGALILYAPANLLPVLETSSPVGVDRDTIVSGVANLWSVGAWPLALVILTASILIPVAKLMALAHLLWSVRYPSGATRLRHARLYRLIVRIGRWSMVDIFVAALVSTLVQFPGATTVTVGPGALAFGAVVVLTMLATETFDPRLIWAAQQEVSS